ncbi:MAG: ABC transporter ATP-binding protein [Desulfomonilaceae bacterium]
MKTVLEPPTFEQPVNRVSAVPLMEVRNLSKHFGGLRAVSSVSFAVEQGEIVGVIGPNGAGKTTLFALLSGFLSATRGDILIEGTSVVGLGPNRLCHLGIARTFQVVRPFADMTVFENVKAGGVFGKPGKRPAREIHDEVTEILENTGLAALANYSPPSLSLPQRKRLEVARALATRPKLLLLDEVLAGLNPREVKEALPFIRSINEDLGVTILMIEHNLRAIMGLSHRILVLNFGQLIFDGKPTDAVQHSGVIQAYLGSSKVAQG